MKTAVCGLVLAVLVAPAYAAVTYTTTQGEYANLYRPVVVGDYVSGMVPSVVFPDDMGWHWINTNPADQWAAFTDDAFWPGAGRPFYGLLNDNQPNISGRPVKHFLYDLGTIKDIGEILVTSGNGGRDGRVFHTYTVSFSQDGQNFSPQIYVQSHPSGTTNLGVWLTAQTRLYDSARALLAQARYVQFYFFSADNTQGMCQDPYDGVNPFTGLNDTFAPAGASPEVWEIDIVPEPASLMLLALGGLAMLRRR